MILWYIRTFIAQWIVIFYPGVIVFWLIIHNKIEKLRRFGTRAYWAAAFAWAITSGPILLFRREIFSIRWIPIGSVEIGEDLLGVMLFVLGGAMYFMAKQQITPRTMIGFPEIKPKENKQAMLHLGIYSKTRNPLYF